MHILLIEDNRIEIMKMKRAISFLKLKHTIASETDGEAALRYLKKEALLPDIILLDLNMPKISGIEFLSLLKNDQKLHHIPIIILTTSDNKKDVTACYEIGVSGYILKPLKYEDYVKKIEITLAYWSTNELKKA
ncbi:MAG: response regulator [Polaribacter sp.]